MLFTLARRNLWRHPKRSILLMLSVASGLWAGLFLSGFFLGMIEQRIALALGTEFSHVQVHAPEFRPDFEATETIPDAEALAEEMAGDARALHVGMRSLAQGMLGTARGAHGATIRGVDPEREHALTGLCDRVQSGSCLEEGVGGILIGEALAERAGIRVGSRVVLTFPSATGDITSGAFRVRGLYRSSDLRLDRTVVYVPRASLNALLELPADAAHQIAVQLSDAALAGPFAEEWQQRTPRLEVQDWRSLSPELDLTVSSGTQSLLIFMIIILMALAFGIVNTMLMAVLERRREIAMLLALGMGRWRVFRLVVIETVLLVLAATPPGFLLAWITVAITARTGIDLSIYAEGLAAYGYEAVVRPELQAIHYMQVGALVAVAAILSAIWPAWKAVRTPPAGVLMAK